MAFDQKKYEEALAMELQKRGISPTAIPTPAPGPAPGGSGAAIFSGLALGAKKGIGTLAKRYAPAIKEMLGFGGAQGAAAAEMPVVGAPSMMMPELAPMLPGGGVASSGAAAGSSALGAGPQATTLLGSTWTGPLLALATAPIWAPKAAQLGEKVSQSIFGKPSPARAFNLEELLTENTSPESKSAYWSNRFLDKQVPSYQGMNNESKSNFLKAANDLGGYNKLILYGEGDKETGQTTKRIGEGLRDDVAAWLKHYQQTGEELRGRRTPFTNQYAQYTDSYMDKLRALASSMNPTAKAVPPQTSGAASAPASSRSRTLSPGIGLDGKRIKY